MSPNVQREAEMDPNGLKRSHDEYSGDEVTIDDRGLDAGVKHQATEGVVQANKAMSPTVQITRDSPPPQSSPASLTDAGTNTPARISPSPNLTPTKSGSPLKQTTTPNPPASSSTPSTAQPAKRKRRTAAEKEAEEKEKAQKKKEREEKKEAKQAEKAKADAEKQAKQAEKAKADAEKQAKQEEKRRKKEEEERSQPKLMSFFTKTKPTPVTPKKEQTASIKTESPAEAATTSDPTPAPPAKAEKSEYERRFKPFFVHETVHMATNPFEMDEETRAVKSKILDEHFDGKRGEVKVEKGKLDAVEIFKLPCRPAPRGKVYPPVRYTMERMQKLTQKAEGAGEEDKKAITKETTDALSKIPVKSIKFWQDVRPPYRGTVTLRPYQAGKDGMRRLARKPTLRDLMPINYDHDSEAEWESEGEDVDIDDDEEEDVDGDDDMDEFLDDSEDNGPARFVSANGLEPNSTGLCWEDRKRMGPSRPMYEHRMEFILESLDHHSGIDPFSTKYWEPEPKAKPAKQAAAATDSKPTNAFQAIGAKNTTQALPKKILENNHLQELKKVIQANPKIAKGGLIDLSYVALAHAKISRNDIKEAIATIAERTGRGQAGAWVVKPLFDD